MKWMKAPALKDADSTPSLFAELNSNNAIRQDVQNT